MNSPESCTVAAPCSGMRSAIVNRIVRAPLGAPPTLALSGARLHSCLWCSTTLTAASVSAWPWLKLQSLREDVA